MICQQVKNEILRYGYVCGHDLAALNIFVSPRSQLKHRILTGEAQEIGGLSAPKVHSLSNRAFPKVPQSSPSKLSVHMNSTSDCSNYSNIWSSVVWIYFCLL